MSRFRAEKSVGSTPPVAILRGGICGGGGGLGRSITRTGAAATPFAKMNIRHRMMPWACFCLARRLSTSDEAHEEG